MLGSLSLILVYLGNVGGNIRWLTINENPIEFGESSTASQCYFCVKEIKTKSVLRYRSVVYPVKWFSLFLASHQQRRIKVFEFLPFQFEWAIYFCPAR